MAPSKANAPLVACIAALLVFVVLASSASSQTMSISPSLIVQGIGSQTATATLSLSEPGPVDCLAIEMTSGASCTTPSGSPTGGCASLSVPACSGNPPTTYPCVMATQKCSPGALGGTCTLSATTASNLQTGTYNFCGYSSPEPPPFTGPSGFNQAGATANLNVVPGSSVSSYVQIEPSQFSSGISEIAPGASANIVVQMSGVTDLTASDYQNDIYIAYVSNFTTDTPVTSLQCPDAAELTNPVFPTPQGVPWAQCDGNYYSDGFSCYTQYPVQTASCSAGTSTCAIMNYTPAFMANDVASTQAQTGYLACAYFTNTGDLVNAVNLANAPFEITSNAPSFGLAVVPTEFYPGSPAPIEIETTPPFSSSSAQYPLSMCNTGNGEVCGIEFAGEAGSAPQSRACASFINLGWGSNPPGAAGPIAPPNLNCTFANGALMPYLGDPLYSGPANSPPCLLTTLPDTYQNQVNGSYTQYMNTQYLPLGTYQFCAYDYMPINFLPTGSEEPFIGFVVNGNELVSPFFATGTVSCNALLCTVTGTSLPYIAVTCPTGGCGIGVVNGGINEFSSIQLNTFQNTACGLYGGISDILLIFAMVLMLLAAAIYAGSSVLPSQSREIARSYALGFLLVSIVALVIATVSVWLLSVSGNVPIANVIGLCK